MGEIYLITNKVNGKGYTGQALDFFSNGRPNASIGRLKTHYADLERAKPGCPLLTAAMLKYGRDNFTLEVLIKCDADQLDYYERKFIAGYGTMAPHGYNLNTGGGGGRHHSEETRLKMGQLRLGKKHSEETKAKIGAAHLGRIVSEETRDRLSADRKKLSYYKPENQTILSELFKELNIEALPRQIGYLAKDKEGRGDGFQVRATPTKKFTSKKLSLVEKYNAAYAYLRSIRSATETGASSATSSGSSC